MEIIQIQTIEEAQRAYEYYQRDDVVDFEFAPGELDIIKKHIFESLDDNYRAYWIAVEADEMIGICGIYQNEMNSGGYYLDYFSIRKDYRGKGIGRKLYEICEDFAREKGGRYIVIETGDGNATIPARAAYENFGYEEVGRVPFYYAEDEGKVIYYKKLNY